MGCSHTGSTGSTVQIHFQESSSLLLGSASHRCHSRRLDPLLSLARKPRHRKAREEGRTTKQKEQDRINLEQLGGKELAIQNFYASPAAVHRGETVQLCYGVANAKKVTLEPQSNPVWPSYARCVDVTPAKTTTYTLTIADAAGHTLTQSLEVKVR